MKKRYAASLSAFTDTGYAHLVYVFYAENSEDAKLKAKEGNIKQFPISEGWKKHTESIVELVECG